MTEDKKQLKPKQQEKKLRLSEALKRNLQRRKATEALDNDKDNSD